MRPAFAALLLAFVPTALTAQVRPQPGAGDPRIQTVLYDADQVVQLQGAPGFQVDVEFAADEQIENVAVGDSAAWQVTPNRRGDHLFVKPIMAGITTNMTVITSARVYLFELIPLYGAAPDMAFTVRFQYPGGPDAVPDTQAAAAVGSYRLSGARSLRPSRIHDDGVHTYILWPEDRALPAVYAIDARGQESLVNGGMRGGTFVIDGVARRLVFRIDRDTARAVRVTPLGQP